MVKLSICITVFNQKTLVKENIQSICKYKGDDIEVIVSDDCSTEDIKEIVEKIGDKRVKYYKTNINVGHDLNILNALKKCTAQYAFVLRSRDRIIPEKISNMIETINNYPEASYYVFSSNDEDGNLKIDFRDAVYQKGMETAYMHAKIFVHPSGNLYNLKYLDIDLLESYICKNFNNVYGFVVHDLIRMKLAEMGDFVTSKEVIWIYTNTHKAVDVAVNASTKKISVYAPEYEYARYQCEYLFVKNEILEELQMIFLKQIVQRFYKSIGYLFKYSNTDKELQRHYSYNEIYYCARQERKKFRKFSNDMWKELSVANEQMQLKKVIDAETIKMYLFYPVKYGFYKVLENNKYAKKIIKKIKHL